MYGGSRLNEEEDEKSSHIIYSNCYPNLDTHLYDAMDPHHHMIGSFPSSSNHHFSGSYFTQIMHDAGEDVRSSCVFPCERNETPSHGLSLSLNSGNPSAIGLQPFELRHSHEYFSGSFIRGSKYLGPTQELLAEFCNLQNNDEKKKGFGRNVDSDDAVKTQSSSSSSLYSLDLLELQARKAKLIRMLEEVDTRYKHYCDQMRSVVSSFESAAGQAATVAYSGLASKAMSRHFRSLKDGIRSQIQATRRALGEKDGSGKGETPRLRVLDQTLRQQRTMQQMGNVEIHPWRPQRGLPERSVSVLRAWLFEHFLHPYPSDVDKHVLARQTGLSRSQVSNWFINARVRLWKPMVEEMYLEELKEDQNDAVFNQEESDDPTRNPDQKPTRDQLVRIDSDCFSSIMNNNQNPTAAFGDHSFGGGMEYDFSPYGNHSSGGGGVSLTLGLHQHGGGVAFSPAGGEGSMFYSRGDEHGMEDDCETAQYPLMDGEGGRNLPYRNLMGAQLLHDLAG